MTVSKKFRLLYFLNKRHNLVSRYGLGVLAYVWVLIITGSFTLALAASVDFIQDNYKKAFRSLIRYNHLKIRIWNRFTDPFFDFTAGNGTKELKALRSLNNRLKHLRQPIESQTDNLLLHARQLHINIEKELISQSQITNYYDLADKVLVSILNQTEDNNSAANILIKPNFKKETAIKVFQDFASLLPIDRWHWFIISGTFLGLHRNGGFLPHDYDIDVGIFADKVDIHNLQQCLATSSQFVIRAVDTQTSIKKLGQANYTISSRLAIIKLIHKTGMQIDIFLHYLDKDEVWHGSAVHSWINSPFSLQKSSFEGIKVNVPAEADQYLTENYGNWQTPVTDFDCTSGTPNMRIPVNLIAYTIFLKRLSYLKHRDNKQYKRLLATLVEQEIVRISNNSDYSFNRLLLDKSKESDRND